jgi:hypothetical protein
MAIGTNVLPPDQTMNFQPTRTAFIRGLFVATGESTQNGSVWQSSSLIRTASKNSGKREKKGCQMGLFRIDLVKPL